MMNQKMLKMLCITVTIMNSLKEERGRHESGSAPLSFRFHSSHFRKPATAA